MTSIGEPTSTLSAWCSTRCWSGGYRSRPTATSRSCARISKQRRSRRVREYRPYRPGSTPRCLRALSKHPDDRFATAAAFAEALRTGAVGFESDASQPTTALPAPEPTAVMTSAATQPLPPQIPGSRPRPAFREGVRKSLVPIAGLVLAASLVAVVVGLTRGPRYPAPVALTGPAQTPASQRRSDVDGTVDSFVRTTAA